MGKRKCVGGRREISQAPSPRTPCPLLLKPLLSMVSLTSDPLKTRGSGSDGVMVKAFSGARMLNSADEKSLYPRPIPSEEALHFDSPGAPTTLTPVKT